MVVWGERPSCLAQAVSFVLSHKASGAVLTCGTVKQAWPVSVDLPQGLSRSPSSTPHPPTYPTLLLFSASFSVSASPPTPLPRDLLAASHCLWTPIPVPLRVYTMATSPPPPSDNSDFDLSLSADEDDDVDAPEPAAPIVVGGKVINDTAAALPVEEGQPPSFVFLARLKKKGKAPVPEGGAAKVVPGGRPDGKPLGLGGEAVRRGPMRKRA